MTKPIAEMSLAELNDELAAIRAALDRRKAQRMETKG